MAEFPTPNPGAFADAAASNFGAILRATQSLREAAVQQQKQADQDRIKQFDAALELQKQGYVPAEHPTGGKLGEGLGQRNPDPNATPHNTIVDPWGRRWYKPDKQDTLTLNEALSKGGQPLDANGQVSLGTLPPIADGLPSQPLNVTPPAERTFATQGGGRVYIPSEETNAADKDRAERAKEDRTAAREQAKDDAKNYTLPDAVTQRLEKNAGLPEGTLKGLNLPKTEVREILSGLAGKTQLPHIDKTTNDAGDVTITAYDPASGKQLWTNTRKGIGEKHKDPDAPAKPKQATPAQLNTIERQKRVALIRAEAAYKKAMKDNPRDPKTGQYALPDDAAQALADLHKAKQAAQDTYESDLANFGIVGEHYEYPEEGSVQRRAQYNPGPRTRAAAAAETKQPKRAHYAIAQRQRAAAGTAAARPADAIRPG